MSCTEPCSRNTRLRPARDHALLSSSRYSQTATPPRDPFPSHALPCSLPTPSLQLLLSVPVPLSAPTVVTVVPWRVCAASASMLRLSLALPPLPRPAAGPPVCVPVLRARSRLPISAPPRASRPPPAPPRRPARPRPRARFDSAAGCRPHPTGLGHP